MPRAVVCFAGLLLMACNAHQEPTRVVGSEPVATALSAPAIAEATAPVQAATAVASPAEASTPGELYAECRDRMEKPESDGECKVDGDCAIAGCSREVCTTRTAAGDIFTTCEMRPCFRAVTTCGCKEGQCVWTLADKMPEGTWHKIDLPDELKPR